MEVRLATERDLPAILRMLFEDRATPSDELGVDDPCYLAALREMHASGTSATYVAEEGGEVVGTFMLIVLRHLMRRGTPVAQLEAVRIHSSFRNRGLGAQMIRWAISESKRRGCSRLELTTHKSRTSAQRFYERLGFHRTHEGLKLPLR
ncbi:MAG TPA: GNAT family N-acetyltransferase [Myxococcales bacterium]|nr:GNAT family N-acetyltransferase [Myxococcales bacterium]